MQRQTTTELALRILAIAFQGLRAPWAYLACQEKNEVSETQGEPLISHAHDETFSH